MLEAARAGRFLAREDLARVTVERDDHGVALCSWAQATTRRARAVAPVDAVEDADRRRDGRAELVRATPLARAGRFTLVA